MSPLPFDPARLEAVRARERPETTGGASCRPYVLRLYLAGASEKSLQAIETVTRICEGYLPGRYRLEVVDVYRTPWVPLQDGIMVVPTLVKVHPLPVQRLIGEASIRARLMATLSIQP